MELLQDLQLWAKYQIISLIGFEKSCSASSVRELNEIFLQMAWAKKYTSFTFEGKKILQVAENS